MLSLCAGSSLASKLCTAVQRLTFMPISSLDFTSVAGSMYISENNVVPVAIISIIASSFPAMMSSAVRRSSMGNTLSNSHSCSGRSLPTPRSSTIAAWQWQLISPGISSRPE